MITYVSFRETDYNILKHELREPGIPLPWSGMRKRPFDQKHGRFYRQ